MRRASVIIAIVSVVVPGSLFGLSLFEAQREAQSGPVCGLPLLSDFLLASLLCVILSAVSVVLGVIAYFRLSPPRPRLRLAEIGAFALPLLLVGGYAGSIIFDLSK